MNIELLNESLVYHECFYWPGGGLSHDLPAKT